MLSDPLDTDELDTIADVMGLRSQTRLNTFREMWYYIFCGHYSHQYLFIHVLQ